MKAILQEHFKAELTKARTAIADQEFEPAWTALQRAHILGQRDPIAHTIAHWNMLKLAWMQQDVQQIVGQLMPTLLALPLTLLYGRVRSLRGGRVSMNDSEKISIPDDLQRILNQ